MGARAQVHIQDNGVYLYTHWGSGSIVEDVQTALASEAGQNRFDDPDYLARIIFEVIKDGDTTGETGFGIGTTEVGDNDLLITVDCNERSVTVSRDDWSNGGRKRVNNTYRLSDFLKLAADG
jgi:hypothetical protein